ncbi:MAG: zinc-binding dehydrogenase [Acidobacteriaceae bacterium]|nr:zinc-binding dehydrogenase [Acidobacteriaceae bacterium]MBV8570857.1 zinc-binding dehydrogenase [Acidobacteriaceae bacterium]
MAGSVAGRTVLIQGAAGSIGMCSVQRARLAGANVIGSVRSPDEESIAQQAGAHQVFRNDKGLSARVKAVAPEGLDHIVEVAFRANINADVELLKTGGSIATYATDHATPGIPYWRLVFKNIRMFFLGSDEFPKGAKISAARNLNRALETGCSGSEIAERVPLADIADAHELVEHPARPGRVVVVI